MGPNWLEDCIEGLKNADVRSEVAKKLKLKIENYEN